MAAADGDAQGKLDLLRDWLNAQPHLPKDIEDRYLRRFLHSCYNDLEKTKSAVELFFTLRASSPELLNNRDPLAEHTKKAMKICNLANLRIAGNKNLWIWQLNDPGLDNYDYVQDAKLFFLSSDAWLMEDDHLEDADVVIMDVKDISLKFITKFNVQCAKKLSKYQEEAMPIRLKQIHVVNSPSAIDKIYALMKPFLKNDITNMVKFHTPKSETLFNYISRDDLPEDYGGTRGTMVEHMKDITDLIIRQRENLINESLWKAIDKKKKTKAEKPVETSSFRSLAID